MKHVSGIIQIALCVLFLAGCNTAGISERIDALRSDINTVRESVEEINLNAEALNGIVAEMKAGNSLSQLIPVTDDNVIVGFILSFSDHSMITVYDQPAYFTVAESEGEYYWKMNGDWIKDADGNRRPVNQESALPVFRTEEETLYVSLDGGQTWETVGKVTDRLIENIIEDENAVHIKLSEGEVIEIPKVKPLSISFTSLPETIAAGETVQIPFTLAGYGNVTVLCSASDGWKVKVLRPQDAPMTGNLCVTAPADAAEGTLLVFVSDGKNTVMTAIDMSSMVLKPAQAAFVVDAEGGEFDVDLLTSVGYRVTVDAGWLHQVATKDAHVETLRFQADANASSSSRTASISFSSGAYSTEISILQKAAETPGPLPGQFDPENDSIEIVHEFRAVWLATLSGMDWPVTGASASSQRSALRSMMKSIKDCNCNAVIFQVCGNSDTYWPSRIYPWSSVLTGTEGKDPGYDPLEYAIDAAHQNGLEIHAWINPMRIGSASKQRAATHPMFKHPEWVHTYDGTNYWDPGYPEVRKMIADVALELVENYEELDGVHMDDYFYPSAVRRGLDGGAWDDAALYSRYGGGRSLDSWREYNIDNIVERIYNNVKDTREDCIFGISPAGRLNNTQALYADPTHWAKKHTIDYLAPQIYWQIGHKVADFDSIAHFWPQVIKNVPIVPGIAASRYGLTGFESIDQYKKQIDICRSIPEIQGAMWFRAKHVTEASFKRYMNTEIYPYPSLIPNYDKYEGGAPLDAPVLSSTGTVLIWNEVAGADGYALYRLDQDPDNPRKWVANMLYSGEDTHFKGVNGCNYTVLAFRKREKSQLSNVIFLNYSK